MPAVRSFAITRGGGKCSTLSRVGAKTTWTQLTSHMDLE